jgi:hypothetical protein
MTNTVWNSGDITAHIALSDTDHTATSGSGSGNEGVRATVSHSTGKWFLEYSNISFPYGARLGFAAAGDTLGGNGQFALDASGITHQPDSSSFSDFGGVNPTGHIIDFAVDLDNSSFWIRYDGGNWNGSGTANPSTNTGGHSLSTLVTPIFPYVWLQFNPCTTTIDGGDYPSPTFAYPAPSGFNPWDGIAGETGTLAATDPTDTMVFIGYPGAFGIIGQVEAVETADAFNALGNIPSFGPMVARETADVFNAFGYKPTLGPLTATEAQDIFLALGVGLGVNGTLTVTEAPDVFAVIGVTPVLGPLAATDAQDRFSALGAGVTQVRPRRTFFTT